MIWSMVRRRAAVWAICPGVPLPSFFAKFPRCPPVWWARYQGTSSPWSTSIFDASVSVNALELAVRTGLSEAVVPERRTASGNARTCRPA